ncbi:hypothetical protein OV450_1376 [Actinobacteria bacterium OV450]|nr:hypothetical protein OV450_1376 [Actinobacteria bacterium OV450]
MTDILDTASQAPLTRYSADRFPAHLPFGSWGYLFTVPGTFPHDIHASLHVVNSQMAVYRKPEGGWEVRDVDGDRRVWADATTRREAVGMAFLEVARVRRARAAEIAENRVSIYGLQPVPPYAVETVDELTLIITPDRIARLVRIRPAETAGEPALYDVIGQDGEEETIEAGSEAVFHTVKAGLLHDRCECNPKDAAHFETGAQALVYAAEAMQVCWPCKSSPAG